MCVPGDGQVTCQKLARRLVGFSQVTVEIADQVETFVNRTVIRRCCLYIGFKQTGSMYLSRR